MLRTCPNCGGLFATGQSEMFGGKPCQCGYAQTFDLSSAELREQTQQLSHQLATATKENTYIRGQLQSVKCPYGHKSENGVCSLGYPGCACADDWFAAQDESNRDLIIKFKDIEAKLAVAIAERDEARLKLVERNSWALSVQQAAKRLEAHNQSLTTLLAELVEAGKKLTSKLDLIHDDQLYKWVWQSFQIHGGDYTNGPKYDIEKEVFEKALAHYAELLKKKE